MAEEKKNSDDSSSEGESKKLLVKPNFEFMPSRKEMTQLIENAVKKTKDSAAKAKKGGKK